MLNKNNLRLLKKGVWLYFFLLIFEGALRKWVLPGLSDPLLLVRDPLAIWLLFTALRENIWRPNFYVVILWGVTILAFGLTLIVGHGNLEVALYGLRITAFHFPLIFIIGCVFDRKDVLYLGKILLWLNMGMTILVALQFYSPQSAWINRGIGGDMEGSGFGGAAGFLRVPGTFAFTTGLSYFYGFAGAYILYFWLVNHKEIVSRTLLIASSFALVAAIPLSISRTVLFEVSLSLFFMLVILKKNPKKIKSLVGVTLIGISLLFILNNFPFFQTASLAFTERFTTANEIEGGMVEGVFIDRFLGGMYQAIGDDNYPLLGMGLGMGSSVGAQVLVGDSNVYLIAEEEWARLIGEFGLLFGLVVILTRVALVVELLKRAWRAIFDSNFLPWMLMSFGAAVILQGQWSQTNSLGFGMLIGGLVIASLKQE